MEVDKRLHTEESGGSIPPMFAKRYLEKVQGS